MTTLRRRMTSSLSLAFILALAGLAASLGGAVSGASEGLGDAVDSLLAHIPESHRDSCRPDLAHDDADAEALMAVHCDLPSGISVVYTQMATPTAANERYQRRLETADLERDTGDCSQQLPGEQSYSIADETAGRLLCYDSFGYDTLHWTHDASGIYSQALIEGDLAALWSWWTTESGPLSTPADSPVSELGAALDALLLHVPEDHRETCLPFDGGGPEDGVVISLRCEVAPDLTVYYDQHVSAVALEADFRKEFESAGITADSGDCSTALPGEMAYTVGGESVGRLLCTDFLDSVWFTWTHVPTMISATASSERTVADTWDWWISESGPID